MPKRAGNAKVTIHRIMVALLQIPFKNPNIPQKRLDEQRQSNREVLNEVPRQMLPPLTFTQHPRGKSRYYNVLCADGNFIRCKPVLPALLAEYPECSYLHHLELHVCFWCECPKNVYGEYVHPDKQHPRRYQNSYRTLSDANSKAADAEVSSRDVHQGFNMFRHIPCIVSSHPKPDLIHTMQIGMLDHLQKWIFHIIKTHEQHQQQP